MPDAYMVGGNVDLDKTLKAKENLEKDVLKKISELTDEQAKYKIIIFNTDPAWTTGSLFYTKNRKIYFQQLKVKQHARIKSRGGEKPSDSEIQKIYNENKKDNRFNYRVGHYYGDWVLYWDEAKGNPKEINAEEIFQLSEHTNYFNILKQYENKFSGGGNIEFFSDNQRMIMNQNVELEHHHEELEDILEDKVEIPAWVVAKMATATQSISDITHYLDGEKDLTEEEDEDDEDDEDENNEENENLKNTNVVEPINVSAGTKEEMTKKFTKDAFGNLKEFLKYQNDIELKDDYTFSYKGENFEVEPIISSDENGVSSALFTIFDYEGIDIGEIQYNRDGGKEKFTANSEFFNWSDAKFEDGGYFDGTIPKVSTYMSTYAKGGEIAKAEIIGLGTNILGTTDIEMKISGMRKPQEFSVYPLGKDDAEKIITIQSSTRIGRLDLSTGRGVMSQSHPNGAYFVHFQMDKLIPFTVNESDLEDIKASVFKTAGSKVGGQGIFSDNSGASGVYAKGGSIEDRLAKLEKKKSDLESKLFDAKQKSHEVMNNIGFGAGMRRSKVSFSTSREDSLKDRIKEVEKQIDDAKKELMPKKPKYILRSDIKTVTVKRKGEEVTYKGSDVLNGANILSDGGDLTSKANYIPKRDVIGVELKDGTTIKPANGYWIKKGAEPIGTEPTPTSKKHLTEKEIDDKLANFTKNDKEFNELQSKSSEESDKSKKLEKQKLAMISKGNYDTDEIEAKIKEAKDKSNSYFDKSMELLKKYQNELVSQDQSSSSKANEPKLGETEIRKDMRGNWRAETNIDNFNDYDWRVSTVKTYSGNLVSSAQAGKTKDSGTKGISMFQYTPYDDPNHTLEVSKPKRLTDKVVSEQHEKALAKFKKFMETGMFKGGGKISSFDKLSAKVAKEYEGKPVKSQYQEEYGKYYSKEEAKEVGDKVAGKVKTMQADKKAFGGVFGHLHNAVANRPKYPDLDGKQVALKSGKYVQVFSQSRNKLSVIELGKIGDGDRPHEIDISEVDMDSFKMGGKISSKKPRGNSNLLKEANDLAKKIRKEGESWQSAKKRAFAQLKSKK